jgi:multiple sugar transport system permease protein
MATDAAVEAGNTKMSRTKGIRIFKWSLLSPLIILALFLLPIFALQLYFSFHSWTIYLSTWWDAEYVGFEMFQEVFTDKRFFWAMGRSFLFAGVSTVGCFIFGLALALLMYRPFMGQAFFYIIFLLPMLTVPIVLTYAADMLLYRQGPINGILSFITGMDMRFTWLANPNYAIFTIIMIEIWNWTPFTFIIMLAGLSSLPHEPVEAARILGANRLQIFLEIQIPLLRPVIFLALILRFLEAMAEFPKTWGLLQGGPGSATETIPIYLYITTWQAFDVSKGAAMSYIIMLIMIVIIFAAIRILRHEKSSLDALYEAPAAGERE